MANVNISKPQGGDSLEVASGGSINIADGGYMTVPVVSDTTAANLSNFGISGVGSTQAQVLTIDAPVAGVDKVIHCTAGTTTFITHLKASSTGGVTFDGTNHVAAFNAAADVLTLSGISTTQWVITGNIGSVVLSTST